MKKRKTFCSMLVLGILLLTGCDEWTNSGSVNHDASSTTLPSQQDDSKTKTDTSGYDPLENLKNVEVKAKAIQTTSTLSQEANDQDKGVISRFVSAQNKTCSLFAFGDSVNVSSSSNFDVCATSGTVFGFAFLQSINKPIHFESFDFELENSNENKIGDYTTGSAIGSGALVILKSFDQNNWSEETYMTSLNGSPVTFTPNSDDVFEGTYYKFLHQIQLRFLARYEEKTTGILWWKKTIKVPVYISFSLKEEINVRALSDSFDIRFVCESLDDATIGDGEALAQDEAKIVQQSTTLTDNSVSTSYIEAIPGKTKTNHYRYTFVGKHSTASGDILNETKFVAEGKYIFNMSNGLGVEKTWTMYIFKPGDDLGLSSLFDGAPVDSTMRMFDAEKKVQTYLVGKKYCIPQIDDSLPGRYGTINYFENEDALSSNRFDVIYEFSNAKGLYEGTFDKEGYYVFSFSASPLDSASGDVLSFRFAYYISGNKNYKPSVNYSLLTDESRSNLLMTKVFGVSLPTTGGGYYQFIYPYSEKYLDSAYSLAVEIEELNVEIVQNGNQKIYYYKDTESQYNKKGYLDKTALYEAINSYAAKNLSVVYLENDIPFGNEIVAADQLSNLAASSLRKTIRVVQNEEILSSLKSNELYLNGFQFTQAADFEVSSVKAVTEEGTTIDIPFGEPLDGLFDKNEKLNIIEQNWNGTRTYQAIYSKNNSCVLNVKSGKSSQVVDFESNHRTFKAKSFEFINAFDEYDSGTLIAISDSDKRAVFSLNEIDDLSLPQGKFTIDVTNRNGQTYSFVVDCDGEISSDSSSVFDYVHGKLLDSIKQAKPDDNVDDDSNASQPAKSSSLPIWACVLIGLAAALAFVVIYVIIKWRRIVK